MYFSKINSNPKLILLLCFGFIFFNLNPLQSQSHDRLNDGIELNEFSNDDLKVIDAKVTRRDLGENKTQVNYTHDCRTEVNPYKVEYSYTQVDHGSKLELPLMSYLAEFDLHFADNVNLAPNGEASVFTSANLKQGQSLSTAKGSYNLEIDDNVLMSYDISLNNREVIGSEKIESEGQAFDGFIIQSNFTLTKTLKDGTELSVTEELIKDWFIPSIGVIKRQRLDLSKSSSSNLISETRF